MINLHTVLQDLAVERPLFHSEPDFQHALAWKLHQVIPEARMRLEFKPFPDERFYLDIWMTTSFSSLAFELKYLPRKLEASFRDERFVLKSQDAQDLGRYDFCKDLVRLERITAHHPKTVGYAILLTNDNLYWTPPQRSTNDAAFRLHDGRRLCGTLAWSPTAGSGTMQGREAPHVLTREYALNWRNYSTVNSQTYGCFRYLLVRVPSHDPSAGQTG